MKPSEVSPEKLATLIEYLREENEQLRHVNEQLGEDNEELREDVEEQSTTITGR